MLALGTAEGLDIGCSLLTAAPWIEQPPTQYSIFNLQYSINQALATSLTTVTSGGIPIRIGGPQ